MKIRLLPLKNFKTPGFSGHIVRNAVESREVFEVDGVKQATASHSEPYYNLSGTMVNWYVYASEAEVIRKPVIMI